VNYAPYIHPTCRKLTTWNGNQFTSLGVCRTKLQNPKNNKRYSIEFVVVEGDRTPLIGLSVAQQMNLITVNDDKLNHVLQVSDQAVTGQFADVFDGKLGRLEGKVRLRVRDEVYPVVMPTRRMSLAVRPKLKVELERMTEAGIIVPVTEPTPWVSQMVATPKRNGDIDSVNKYFASIATNTSYSVDNVLKYQAADIALDPGHYIEEYITCYEVERLLRLQKNTSPGCDLLPSWLMRTCSFELASLIVHIYNCSIHSGINVKNCSLYTS